jgi:hypothetical protein
MLRTPDNNLPGLDFGTIIAQFSDAVENYPLAAAAFLGSNRALLEILSQLVPEPIRTYSPLELELQTSFSSREVITILDPENLDHTKLIDWLQTSATTVEQEHFKHAEKILTEEYQRVLKTDELPPIHYYFNRKTGKILPVLPEELAQQVTFSRVDLLYSKEELQTLRKETTVIVLGASTGDVPIQAAAKMGMRVLLWEGDLIETGNLPRLDGGRYSDLAESKAVVSATRAMDVYPYSDVTAYPHYATVEELTAVIEREQAAGRRVIVVDSIDKLDLKYRIRELQKGWALTHGNGEWKVVMGTNMHTTLINHETGKDKAFHSEINFEEKLAMLADVRAQFQAGRITKAEFLRANTEVVIAIIGQRNIPVRQMFTFLLMAVGEIDYLVQDGVHAYISGAAVAETIIQTALGRTVEDSSLINMDDQIGTPDLEQAEAELAYVLSRMNDFPSLGHYRQFFEPLNEPGKLSRQSLTLAMQRLTQAVLSAAA